MNLIDQLNIFKEIWNGLSEQKRSYSFENFGSLVTQWS